MRIAKCFSPRCWSIQAQIIMVVLVCLFIINYVAGQVARQYEEPALREVLQEQNYNNYWLLRAAVMEAVISEDVPVLESFSRRVTETDKDIIFLEIRNENDVSLVRAEKKGVYEEDYTMSFSDRFIVEGEDFGSLIISWNLQSIYAEANEYGKRLQLSVTIALIALTLMILSLLHWVLVKPMRKIHQRLNDISNGDLEGSLSVSTSAELMYLSDSVNELSNALIYRDKYERELEAAQLSLQKLSKQNELILNSAGEGIYGIDMDGHSTFVNLAAARMTGWEPEVLLGKDMLKVFHQANAENNKFDLYSVFTDGVIRRVDDGVFYRKDGSAFHVEYVCTPIIEDGMPIGAVVIFRDITDKINAVKDLSKAIDQAREANKVKSEFLAVISHEIRTPLNAVIGATNLLLDTPLNEEQKIFVSTAVVSGEALLVLINDVLDYSKLVAGKMILEKVDFDIIALAEEICELFNSEVRQKQIALEVIGDSKLPKMVSGDSGRLRQILLNLISNAVKFTDVGGIKLFIDFLGDVDGRILLSIKVQDTGIGISEEVQSCLFDEFSQVDPSFTRKYGGTGLGLAITKNIVNLMDGDIRCKSEQGKGSVFEVNIKLWEVSNNTVVPATEDQNEITDVLENINADGSVVSNGGRILLVEDSMANQVVAMAYLKKAGYSVDSVANGREAIAAVTSLPYGVILMDLAMPVMDGFEATKIIRNLGGDVSHIPIIAMTANTMQGDKEACLLAGMNDYLSKPINKFDLFKKLAQWMPYKPVSIVSNTDNDLHHDGYSVIDYGVLKQLEKDTSADIVPNIINVFIKETARRLKIIKEICATGDYLKLQEEVHVMKSSAATYGASALRDIAVQVDIACKEKRNSDALDMALDLLPVGDDSLDKLKEYIRKIN